MALGLVIQSFMRINMDYMIKILMEAAMRAAKDFDNFNIFLIHSVCSYQAQLIVAFLLDLPDSVILKTLKKAFVEGDEIEVSCNATDGNLPSSAKTSLLINNKVVKNEPGKGMTFRFQASSELNDQDYPHEALYHQTKSH